MNYTTVDRILSKLYREIPEDEVYPEDVIEWIGEALDFLKVNRIMDKRVKILKVENHEAYLPKGLQYVIQLAKLRDDTMSHLCTCSSHHEAESKSERLSPTRYEDEPEEEEDNIDDCGCEDEPRINLDWVVTLFGTSTHQSKYTPIRLANHTFFNSIVCKPVEGEHIYKGCTDEYTIIGTAEKKLRFSFKEGLVAIAYLESKCDNETGYPYIPDDPSYISALTYYVKWKMSERKMWEGDRLFASMTGDMERKWVHYAGQAKNKMKMPQSLDEYQNLLEGYRYMLPRDKYYGFFGNIGRNERMKGY